MEVRMAATPITASPLSREARPDRPLFIIAVLLVAAIVFAGFARTFYLKVWFGTPPLTNLLVLHGLVMTAWIALFIAQVALVETGRTDLHRKLGVAGLVLAALVIVVGVTAALDAGRRGFTPSPQVPPHAFMAIPLMDIVVFAVLVGAALLKRRSPATHKRLMLLAVVGSLTPAVARLPIDALKQIGVPAFFGITTACVLLLIAIDTVRNRRLHPAFGWGGAFWLASVPGRFVLGMSDAWAAVARRLTMLIS
jgi:hypothetical protein